MWGDLVNLNFKAFNKHCSGLKVKCSEIPHYAYLSRYALLENKNEIISNNFFNWFCKLPQN
jgi:hypothetical protein